MPRGRDDIKARPPKTELADWIKERMQRRGWNQNDLADALGTSYQQVSRWVRGTQRPSWQWIVEIAHVFGADPMRLLVLAEWLPERVAPGGVAADMAALMQSVAWNDDRVAWVEQMVSRWREIDEASGVRTDGKARRVPG